MSNTLLDELEDKVSPENQEDTELDVPMSPGLENFKENLKLDMFNAPQMNVARAQPTPPGLFIRTTDQQNFRVYLTAHTVFDSKFNRKICRFLNSRKEGETVTFLLGTKSDDGFAPSIGPILTAMQTCRAKVITLAMGYCSIPETMIWAYGHERKLMQYGALSFGRTDVTKVCEVFTDYFKVFLQRSLEIGMVTEEEIEELLRTGKEKLVMSADISDSIHED